MDDSDSFEAHFKGKFGKRGGNLKERAARERLAGRTVGERRRGKGPEPRSVQLNARITPNAKQLLELISEKKSEGQPRPFSQADALIAAIEHYAKTIAKIS